LTIRVTRNRALTANFTYSLTTSVVGTGSVTRNPNQRRTPRDRGGVDGGAGQRLALQRLDRRHGDDDESDLAGDDLESQRDCDVRDQYVHRDLQTVGNGNATKNPNQATYNHGTSVTLTATPNSGNSFVSWSGDTATTRTADDHRDEEPRR